MSYSLSSKALNKTTILPFIDIENMLMTESVYDDHAPAPGMLLFTSLFFNSWPNSNVRISTKAYSPSSSSQVIYFSGGSSPSHLSPSSKCSSISALSYGPHLSHAQFRDSQNTPCLHMASPDNVLVLDHFHKCLARGTHC